MDERRRFPRLSAPSEVFGRVKTAIPARIVDISEGGVQLELTGALSPASECRIMVPTTLGERYLQARVCRCKAQAVAVEGGSRLVFRAGLEFVDLSDEDRGAIASGIGGDASSIEIGADAPAVDISEATA